MSKLLDLIMQNGIDFAVLTMLEMDTTSRVYDKQMDVIEFEFIGACGELRRKQVITWTAFAYQQLGKYDTGRDQIVFNDAYEKMRSAMRTRIHRILTTQVNFTAPEDGAGAPR